MFYVACDYSTMPGLKVFHFTKYLQLSRIVTYHTTCNRVSEHKYQIIIISGMRHTVLCIHPRWLYAFAYIMPCYLKRHRPHTFILPVMCLSLDGRSFYHVLVWTIFSLALHLKLDLGTNVNFITRMILAPREWPSVYCSINGYLSLSSQHLLKVYSLLYSYQYCVS